MQSSMFAFENNGLFVLKIFVPLPLFSVKLMRMPGVEVVF